MSDELLSMFFDDEFVPHAYLDAFFNIDSQNNNLKKISNIQQLQQRSSNLLSNLDFLTNELTNDLEDKIKKLYNSNSIISYSYNQNDESTTSKLKPTSRLEYYIDSLLISIQSLNELIDLITTKITTLQSQNIESNSTVQKLINLSISKTNLLKILKFLELIKSIIDINSNEQSATNVSQLAPTSASKSSGPISTSTTKEIIITPKEFQNALDILRDTILEQFDKKIKTENNTTIDFEFLKKINNFITLLPIFKNLNKFYSIYSEFVKKVNFGKQDYLNSKNLDYFDDDDELFKKVLN